MLAPVQVASCTHFLSNVSTDPTYHWRRCVNLNSDARLVVNHDLLHFLIHDGHRCWWCRICPPKFRSLTEDIDFYSENEKMKEFIEQAAEVVACDMALQMNFMNSAVRLFLNHPLTHQLRRDSQDFRPEEVFVSKWGALEVNIADSVASSWSRRLIAYRMLLCLLVIQ